MLDCSVSKAVALINFIGGNCEVGGSIFFREELEMSVVVGDILGYHTIIEIPEPVINFKLYFQPRSMSAFPGAGPSQTRSPSAALRTKKSEYTSQYTSAEKAPMTPAPSPSSSSESDHNPAKSAFTRDPVERCTESPLPSTTQDDPPNRLAVLYHKYNPRKVFENRGSTARDHLASERTFLAYVRTSLALASAGVALVQLFTISDLTLSISNTSDEARMQMFARPLGVLTVAMALFMLVIGTSANVLMVHS
jgi:uncharacterized membrane protein YidH (DUF202 family)